MLDLLLMFYNGEHETSPATLLDSIASVLEILNFWRVAGIDGKLTAKSILNFMVDQVVSIISEIRTKLLYKACFRFKIVSFTNSKEEKKVDDSDKEAADPAELLDDPIISDYRDKTYQYDQFAYTLWKYLELLDRTAPLIEDLYLSILEALDLERPNPFSIFKSIHW